MAKKIRRIIGKLRDIALLLIGAILTPWAIFRWHEVGFRIEPQFYAGKKEGNAFLAVALVGIAMISYGVFNLLLTRHRETEKKTNGTNVKCGKNTSQ
jgi:hypothetical protein